MRNDTMPADEARQVAQHEAISKVNDHEITVTRSLARGSGAIDYGFYVLYGLLTIRLVLALIAARSTNGFVRLIQAVTDPFYAMFRGIVPSPSVDGGFTLVLPIVIAIFAYALLHLAINGLLRMIAHRKTEI